MQTTTTATAPKASSTITTTTSTAAKKPTPGSASARANAVSAPSRPLVKRSSGGGKASGTVKAKVPATENESKLRGGRPEAAVAPALTNGGNVVIKEATALINGNGLADLPVVVDESHLTNGGESATKMVIDLTAD